MVGFPTETTSFVLLLSDPARIAEAREIIEQAQDDRHIFGGRIVKESAAWNPPWSYYVDPGSVVFAQAFIEVCDADPRYVEEHLDEVGGAFLPGNYWCPWSSRLLREVQVFQPQGRVYLPLILRGVDYVSAIATHRVSAADRSAAAMTPWM